MSTTVNELRDLLPEFEELYPDENLIEGEDVMSSREFLLDYFSELMEGDQDDEAEGTESEEGSTSDALESRQDEIIDNIFDQTQDLKYSPWFKALGAETLFQEDSTDQRDMSDEDMEKGGEVLRKLEMALMGLPNLEDRKNMARVMRNARHGLEEQRQAYMKLDDIAESIRKRSSVSIDTHEMLCGLGLGMESYLPDVRYYSTGASTINLEATLEAIDAKKAGIGAITILISCGVIYKVVKWLMEKFGKNAKKAMESMKDAVKEADKLRDTNDANRDAETTLSSSDNSDTSKIYKEYLESIGGSGGSVPVKSSTDPSTVPDSPSPSPDAPPSDSGGKKNFSRGMVGNSVKVSASEFRKAAAFTGVKNLKTKYSSNIGIIAGFKDAKAVADMKHSIEALSNRLNDNMLPDFVVLVHNVQQALISKNNSAMAELTKKAVAKLHADEQTLDNASVVKTIKALSEKSMSDEDTKQLIKELSDNSKAFQDSCAAIAAACSKATEMPTALKQANEDIAKLTEVIKEGMGGYSKETQKDVTALMSTLNKDSTILQKSYEVLAKMIVASGAGVKACLRVEQDVHTFIQKSKSSKQSSGDGKQTPPQSAPKLLN